MASSVHPDAILGPDSVSAAVLGHPAILLGGPRALLLQVAHPAVAAGVVDHSDFEEDPYRRLARTFEVMHAIAFGSPDESIAAARGLAGVHRRVHGTTADGVPYSATDPSPALWVHATLVDSALVVERRYVRVLDDRGRARFYDESRALAAALGVPDAVVPSDLDAFGAYMASMEEDLLVGTVGAAARRIAAAVLHPPATAALGLVAPLGSKAAARLVESVTVDLGPPALCRAYGLPEALDAAAAKVVVGLVAGVSRAASPLLPGAARDPAALVRLTARMATRSAPRGGRT